LERPKGTEVTAAWWSRALAQLTAQAASAKETVSVEALLAEFLNVNRIAVEDSSKIARSYDEQLWTDLIYTSGASDVRLTAFQSRRSRKWTRIDTLGRGVLLPWQLQEAKKRSPASAGHHAVGTHQVPRRSQAHGVQNRVANGLVKRGTGGEALLGFEMLLWGCPPRAAMSCRRLRLKIVRMRFPIVLDRWSMPNRDRWNTFSQQ